MNNSKKTLAAGAGAGVLALALLGGGTFAAWSDYATVDNNTVGADTLRLDLKESASVKFDNVKLAPGQAKDTAYFIASRTGVSTPNARLTATVQNLDGWENGCDSNSEMLEDNGLCNDTARDGSFIDESLFYLQTKTVASPAECNTSDSPTALRNTVLRSVEDKKIDLGTLKAGEGVCVLATVFMPDSTSQYGVDATNKSQGDQASFDLRFDLTQITKNHP